MRWDVIIGRQGSLRSEIQTLKSRGTIGLRTMRLIDEQYLRTPFYGSRRMTAWLQSQSQAVIRKRVQRLMRLMGLEGLAPGPRTSRPAPEHKVYPYLLRNLEINQPDQVWCTDITYVPMPSGFMYLVAIMDWYSRYVLAWELSNTLDTGFCLEALEVALAAPWPEAPTLCWRTWV